MSIRTSSPSQRLAKLSKAKQPTSVINGDGAGAKVAEENVLELCGRDREIAVASCCYSCANHSAATTINGFVYIQCCLALHCIALHCVDRRVCGLSVDRFVRQSRATGSLAIGGFSRSNHLGTGNGHGSVSGP